MSFVAIGIAEYVELFVQANPGSSREVIRDRLERALARSRSGARCQCGERIWVIGSAEVGAACFTCITGEAAPSSDYELAEVLLEAGR